MPPSLYAAKINVALKMEAYPHSLAIECISSILGVDLYQLFAYTGSGVQIRGSSLYDHHYVSSTYHSALKLGWNH